MSKFKVGDKVKIVRCSGDANLSLSERSIAVGEEYIIESVNPSRINPRRDHYGLVGREFVVYDLELELVESKHFTKSDLKDGMVIEYRNGERALVITDRFLSTNGWMSFDDYDSELFRTFSRVRANEWDIVKCYKVESNTGLCMLANLLEDPYLGLIWERKEEPKHKEMTVEEIEKELGYKIKVIADKE